VEARPGFFSLPPGRTSEPRAFRGACDNDQKWGNGTRRFVSMADAQTYFERLKTVPLYQELVQKRLALEKWRRENALNRLSPLGKGKNPAVK
jgi:hypothetical protein